MPSPPPKRVDDAIRALAEAHARLSRSFCRLTTCVPRAFLPFPCRTSGRGQSSHARCARVEVPATIRGRDGMPKRLMQRLVDRLRATRRRPVVCRRCGAVLGRGRAVLRDGRVRLEGLDGVVRVRWTGEDELSFEHVRAAECERR
jgi:hypothetical protein